MTFENWWVSKYTELYAQQLTLGEAEFRLLREAWDAACAEKQKEIDALQARIDALMLEYCPEEMTDEQLHEWGEHQIRTNEALQQRINEEVAKEREACVLYVELIRDDWVHADDNIKACAADYITIALRNRK